MKKLMIAFLMLSMNAFSAEYAIQITNETDYKVSFGSYVGIPFPSWCKDGFCLEDIAEVFVPKFGFRKIEGSKVSEVSYSDFESKEHVIRIDGVKHVGIYSCEQAEEYDLPEVQEKLIIDMTSYSAYCVKPGFTEIEINI